MEPVDIMFGDAAYPDGGPHGLPSSFGETILSAFEGRMSDMDCYSAEEFEGNLATEGFLAEIIKILLERDCLFTEGGETYRIVSDEFLEDFVRDYIPTQSTFQ
jgi:hypothetical protein